MNHIERMRALRTQVDVIIEHTETLAELDAHDGDTIGLCAFVSRPSRPDLKRHLAVPIAELRALVKRRIDAAEGEIRKLGLVAPRPAPVVFTPGALERGKSELQNAAQIDPAHAQAEGLVVEPSSGLYARRSPYDLANPGS